MPVCLIVPCYNEAGRLNSEVFAAFVAAHPACHVCLVNDGSTDATRSVIDALSARHPAQIEALHLEKNQGKAEAVRRGMLHAAGTGRFDVVGYWDADLAAPLTELAAMLTAVVPGTGRTVAIGSRLRRLGSSIDRGTARHALGRLFATAASLVLGLPIYDSQCGAKIFHASLVPVLFGEPFSTAWLFDVELLARLRNHLGRADVLKATIEVPLTEWSEVGGSKMSVAQMAAAPLSLLRIHLRYNRQ